MDAKVKKGAGTGKEESKFKHIYEAQQTDKNLNPSTTTRVNRMLTKLSGQGDKKGLQVEHPPANTMLKAISPFKVDAELEKLGNAGVMSFLPSYHEHKISLLKGTSKKGDAMDLQDETHSDPKKNLFKRSGTMLLGNIKDPSSNKTSTAGVVPKDLGLGLIKDLLDLDELEAEERQLKKNSSRGSKQFTKKRTNK